MTKILAISSALPYAEISLTEGKKTLYYAGWYSDYDEAAKLLFHLRKILDLNTAIDGVIVGSGPGGFTGLRVGVAMANTIAFANNVKIGGINTDDLLQKKLHRVNLKKEVRIMANGKEILHFGRVSPPGLEKTVELEDLKPLNEIAHLFSPGEKFVIPKYKSPPKITKSKKPLFK